MAVDPEFVTTLKGDIQGVFWSEAAKYPPETIAREFRNAVDDRQLMTDERFAANLMFIVRKRDVVSLRDEVFREYRAGGLPPEARISATKTAYAIGGQREREVIDRDLANRLGKDYESSAGLTDSRALDISDGVGGAKTLAALKEIHPQVQKAQREAEAGESPDFDEIKKLDRIRSTLETKIAILELKQKTLAQKPQDRLASMAELYLGRRRFHEAWAYKYLLNSPQDEAIVGVRAALVRVASLVPQKGLPAERREAYVRDARLRGVCLLELLGARLNENERNWLTENAELIQANEALYRPNYDWEDVLDRR
jgi:hypothetical protein